MPIHVGEVATYYKDYERERAGSDRVEKCSTGFKRP